MKEEGPVVAWRVLWRNIAIVSGILTVIAPLFGLLGTVFGMVDAFDTMGIEGGGDPEELAENISFSLITTAGGFVVSGICLIAFLISLILMIRSRPSEPTIAEDSGPS